MPLSDAEEAQIKEILKPAVQEYIEALADFQSDIKYPPTIEIHHSAFDGSSVSRELVSHPSRLIHHFQAKNENDPFQAPIESLLDKDLDPPAVSPVELLEPVDNDVIEELNSDNTTRTRECRRLVRTLIRNTLDYAGEYEFHQEAFDAVFEDHIRPLWDYENTIDVIIPISGLSNSFSPIELPPFQIEHKEESSSIARLCKLEIGPFTKSEMSGLRTVDSEFDGLQRNGFSGMPANRTVLSRVRGTVFVKDHSETATRSAGGGSHWESLARELVRLEAKRILKMLRLYGPNRKQIKLAHVFTVKPHWITHREGVEYLTANTFVSDPWVSGIHSGTYEFDDADAQEFAEQWSEYGEYLSEDTFSQPLRRFNQAFGRNTSEDRLIDCFLGFESSVLKGVGSPAFRLPARSTLLLSGEISESEEVFEFFKIIRKCRNEIVHHDTRIQDINIDDENSLDISKLDSELVEEENLNASEFEKRGRVYLAMILKKYMELKTAFPDQGSIQEINNNIVEPRIIRSISESGPIITSD
ncbi:hypothetical protein ACFQE1_01735 [Halobium palmae]|uniref:Apea-like HEPN domain-containing protein n=1 Tax=Halobium palmae TaxID=1776492 RepID=A0ABD5RVE4_9EURY